MKPIPTIYNGIEHRSRLEARWSVFFDYLSIQAHYEPFSIKSEDGKLEYTPDFLLQYNGVNPYSYFVEIKPLPPNNDYIDYLSKVYNANLIDAKPILIMVGEPNLIQPKGIIIERCVTKGGAKLHICRDGFALDRCDNCGIYSIVYDINTEYACYSHFCYYTEAISHDDAVEYAANYRFDLALQKQN